MIDFRYHVVSIIAVFLALALGLFLGSTALQGVVFNDLQKNFNRVDKQRTGLVSQVDTLNAQLGAARAFDGALEPYAVAGRLSGQLVVVVSAPGANGDARSRLVTTLERAGATVTADVRLQSAFVDPKQQSFVAGLADRLSVPGRTIPAGSGTARAVAQIADVLGVRPTVRPVPTATVQEVLGAYADGNLLSTPSVHGNPPRPGTLAVLLTGAPPPATADAAQVESERSLLVDLVSDLDSASLGVAVVGPLPGTGQSGDLVSAVASKAGSGVSSVRGVDTSAGRIETVFALADQLDGRSGSYAVAPGAAPLPTPSP